MKKLVLLSIAFIGLLICLSSNLNAQGVGINSFGNNPDPSALLDLSSTNKGTLITRMTTAQRNAIASPAEGLQIFNTTTKCSEMYVYGFWQTVWCATCPAPAAPTTSSHNPSSTQIVWNWSTVSGATGYKYNTVNTYSTATDNGTSTSYTQTNLTCNTAYTLYVWAYNFCGGISSATILTQSTSACPWTCGNTLTISHTIGTVAPETKTINYGTVTTSLSGASKCWITQNLGADNQAASATDASDAAAGWYWQFNRKQGYKVGPIPSWNTTPTNEASNWLAVNDPCTIELGAGWRIPNYTEWTNTDANGAWNNYTAPFNSVLKIHNAGYLNICCGALFNRAADGDYWSSTQNNDTNGWYLNFYPTGCNMDGSSGKNGGFSVRCIKD